MTPRERFVACLTFQPVDRIPFTPGYGRESTRRVWHSQGLPAHVTDELAYIRDLIGIDHDVTGPPVDPGVRFTMIPEFEEKIIEQRARSRIVQDWKGNICEIGNQFDPSYLRGGPDFVTRRWIRCPVATREDWPDMARRYDVHAPLRLPDDFDERCGKLADRDYVVGFIFPGPFWQLREWLGFEGLCILLMDDPSFAQQMIDFWRDFIAEMLQRTFSGVVPDYVMINEDMAYKEKPMIGPGMCRSFLVDCWRTWGEICKSAGVPIYGVDSDGFIESLVPVWLEVGLHWTSPLEVAAGNDLPALRRRHGTAMAYCGGVDKRAIAKGGRVLRDEIERLAPVVQAGGYIPGCDHGVPADVPWDNYVEYCRLLARVTGWL